MDSCDRSLLILEMSDSVFVILQDFDDVLMQFVDLSQRFGCARLDLMSPTDERSRNLDAEMPKRCDDAKCRTDNRKNFGRRHLSVNKGRLAFRLGRAGALGGVHPTRGHQAAGDDGCFLDDVP
jgi:hypothetical protein